MKILELHCTIISFHSVWTGLWSYILHVYHKYRLKMFFTVSLKTDNSMKVTFDVDSFKPTVKTLFREKKEQVGVLAGLFRA